MNMNNFQDNLKELDVSLLDAYVGKRLKLRRVMLRMSQDELASMIGVTFQQIQKYENGSPWPSGCRKRHFGGTHKRQIFT